MHKKDLKQSRVGGFSLFELLIAMTITLVLLGLASALLASSFKVRSRENQRTEALADAQRGFNLITREIANSGYGLTDNGIVSGDSGLTSIRVRANLNASEKEATSDRAMDKDEDVKYANSEPATSFINPNFALVGAAIRQLFRTATVRAMYTKAIRYRPNDVDLRRNLGLAYFNIGSYSEAIKAYQRAIEISPTDGQAHYYLGLVHLDREDKESAMEEQKKLEELGHDDLATLLLDEVQRQTWRMAPGTDRAQEARPRD